MLYGFTELIQKNIVVKMEEITKYLKEMYSNRLDTILEAIN